MTRPLIVSQSSDAAGTDRSRIWSDLPELPFGIGGHAVAAIGDAILVAGGSVWTAAPWKHGKKQYRDDVMVLREFDGVWETVGRLPVPVAYAACAASQDELYVAGGENADGVLRNVYSVSTRGSVARVVRLPNLPCPLTDGSGAVLEGIFHVCCGQTGPDLKSATNRHWALVGGRWVEQDPLPGVARILPICQPTGGCFTLGSGAGFRIQSDRLVRSYLKDVWRFDPRTGWQEIGSLFVPCVAAPSLAYGDGLFIFGGDDGSLASAWHLQDQHPGFSKSVTRVSANSVRGLRGCDLPISLVTSGTALWRGRVVIAGGEDRAGSRSARVLACKGGALVENEN